MINFTISMIFRSIISIEYRDYKYLGSVNDRALHPSRRLVCNARLSQRPQTEVIIGRNRLICGANTYSTDNNAPEGQK